jgi:predicted flap endonuclease-1-like 5' DNA nuclease
MSNGQITSGRISHGRTVNLGEFNSKKAEVELSFNIADGEDHDAVIEHVTNVTHAHLARILKGEPTAGVTETAASAEAKKKKAATRMPKTADAEDPALADTAEQNTAAAKIEEADDLEDLLGTGPSPAKEITDRGLMDAVQKCQATNKNAPAIKKALNECGVKTPPGRVIDLPQDKRQKYIDLLAQIKPLA